MVDHIFYNNRYCKFYLPPGIPKEYRLENASAKKPGYMKCGMDYYTTSSHWEIYEDKLYLIAINSPFYQKITEPVFAKWFSNKVFISDGKLLGFDGYYEVCEFMIIMYFEEGIAISKSYYKNIARSILRTKISREEFDALLAISDTTPE